MTPSHAPSSTKTGVKALTGAHMGRVWSREIRQCCVPTLLRNAEVLVTTGQAPGSSNARVQIASMSSCAALLRGTRSPGP